MSIKIKHDTQLRIAEGHSRKERKWKNKVTSWSAFLARIETTHRTHETFEQYKKMSKEKQSEIKDVGGFVGGYLRDGIRSVSTVEARQLITLDADYDSTHVWETYMMVYNNAAAYYTTHKHAPSAQRLRLIIPLDREVGREEYEAIARRLASDLDIEAFDDSTYQPSRLMYWPSTSADGEYLFDYLDAPIMSADEVLSTYRNWRDVSEWPVSDRQGEIVIREQKKQGDPLTKGGWIGGFCKTYSIEEAIEKYLSDIYSPAEGMPGRYTYIHGSTAGGVIVYDNKFSFSHHSTDPAAGKLLNAFDLVRIHLFGEGDTDVAEGTPIHRTPSFLAMEKMIMDDERVGGTVSAEKIEAAAKEFGESNDIEDINTDAEWIGKLERDKKGECQPTTMNVLLVLRNDPNMKKRFALDKFSRREISTGNLPWRKVRRQDMYLTDSDDASLRCYLEQVYRIKGKQVISDALAVVLEENSFHPVEDYLSTLVWDGKPRIETLLIDYLGANDTPYVRAATKKTLVAAIKRIYYPGYKFDTVLTLVGPQGVGKSTLIRLLGKDWFSDSFATIAGKEAYEAIQGVWLVEMGELAGMRKIELNAIKHFLSKTEDRYRMAYGRRTENFPRQCIFFGTTNDYDFLRDPTGDRRWWPVDVGANKPIRNIFKELTPAEVSQIWAEAITLEAKGESVVMDADLAREALAMQQEHTEVDERLGLIVEYLETPVPENWDEKDMAARRAYFSTDPTMRERGTHLRNYVCVAEVYVELFGGYLKDLSRFNTKEYNLIMRNIKGWEPLTTSRFGPYGIQRAYKRRECNYVERYQKAKIDEKSVNTTVFTNEEML